MKILLDECLPKILTNHLPGHVVFTVQEMGWAGIKNGALLKLLEPEFDVFITMDGNLQHQQTLAKRQVGFVVLSALDNRIPTLIPLMPKVVEVLRTVIKGEVKRVEQT